jgi:TPP-dependent 2-oxoacid decarboxylase
MNVAAYLFHCIQRAGVTHTFGIPGDYALPLYAAQSAAGLKTVVMTHEPCAGYAADVYARLKGLGVALVTFGVGALNLVNAIAMAYAEESPVLVVSGAPDVHWQETGMLFHHRVKSHETQLRVFREVTVAQASITSPEYAIEQIDEVLEAMRRSSRPGFIEIARDITFAPARQPSPRRVAPESVGQEMLEEALGEIIARLNASRRPIVYAGVEIERFGLMELLRELVEKANIPVATSLMGKAVLSERHPNFIGNYFGNMGQESVRQYVEDADCVLALGMLFSDVDMAFDSSRFPRGKLIQATTETLSVSHHLYQGVTLTQILKGLVHAQALERHHQPMPQQNVITPLVENLAWGTAAVVEELNAFLQPFHLVISDTGDCLFASVELRAEQFIGPGYYASMGLAIPGAVAAQLARPDLRPIVLVGDGAFKMTGLELGTARDQGLNPIVVLLNNRSLATLEAADRQRAYYQVRPWDYVALARSLGGEGVAVANRSQLRAALQQATQARRFFLIDAQLPTGDASPTLQRLGQFYGGKIGLRTMEDCSVPEEASDSPVGGIHGVSVPDCIDPALVR